MREIAQSLFDVYALALPAGLAFGNDRPCCAWMSDSGETLGAITRNLVNGTYGYLVMRRRVDDVWVTLKREVGMSGEWRAKDAIEPFMEGFPPREPIPPGVQRRQPLWDIGGIETSNIFRSLVQPPRRVGAWMLNQLYLAMPNPDHNWVRDCQTENFHTRLWEACLLACFREEGLTVRQDHPSPDFQVLNRAGDEAWIEAVTTNPTVRFDHFGATPTAAPEVRAERLIGPAAVRFAKTIRSKLQKNYHLLPHVTGKPFAIAIADFHAPGSMTWSREALPCYLYGQSPKIVEVDGKEVAQEEEVKVLLGAERISAGLFMSDEYAHVSAILFSNGCTLPKLSRVGISAGASETEYRYVRIGEFFDRTPGALVGIPFCMDVASQEYKDLWKPYGYEPWSAELEVYHNPYAAYPIPNELFPEASHWRMVNGEGVVQAFYPYSILRSRTVVQKMSDPMLTLEQILEKRDAK